MEQGSLGAIRVSAGSWMKFLGERLRRLEDPRFLTGRGRYVADLSLPGMLDVVLVRSTHAHARIRTVDTGVARRRPGVVDVVTSTDLGPADRPLPVTPPHSALRGQNWTLLARDRVRFVGEAVAAVIAENRCLAEDASEAIHVEYEPLPSVQSLVPPVAAMVHDDVPDNVAGTLTLA